MVLKQNNIIVDKAFVSTSKNTPEVLGRNVILTIKLPKGYKNAIDIEEYASPKYRYQKEVLLNRNCKFYVNDVIIWDNKYYLDVEALE